MPTDLTIVHPEDFIRATQTGALDLDASRELLRGIVSRLKAAGVHHVLIDLRQTTPGEHLSKSELISSNSVAWVAERRRAAVRRRCSRLRGGIRAR